MFGAFVFRSIVVVVSKIEWLGWKDSLAASPAMNDVSAFELGFPIPSQLVVC